MRETMACLDIGAYMLISRAETKVALAAMNRERRAGLSGEAVERAADPVDPSRDVG